MRHVPISIFAIVAIVGIMTLLFSVPQFYQPSAFAVSYIPSQQQPSSNTVIAYLDVNEMLGNEIVGLTGVQLAGLSSGTFNGKDVTTSYVQSLKFREPGVFNGGQLVFGSSENNVVSDFLQFTDAVFMYQVDFGAGLRSVVDGGSLPDIEEEDIDLLGDTFMIVDTEVNTGSNDVGLRMFGGYGSIDLFDTDYTDNNFHNGVKINGQFVDAQVKIKASLSGDKLSIYSIQYILNANAAQGGDLQVLPLHCAREYLQYPLGLISPNFDICYKGLSGAAVPVTSPVSGNQILVRPAGDDEYKLIATNLHGRTYQIPLAQLPGSYGNKGRDLIFVEAANFGAPNIDLDDYVMVMSRDNTNGISNVLMYDHIDGNTVYFEDLAGGSNQATFDVGTMEGDLLVGEGTYHFRVGAGNSLAMDQTNDGDANSDEARFITVGGHKLDLGPGFTVTLITPQKLFDEATADEETEFDIIFGGDIDLNVPSPQVTLPGYSFELQDAAGGLEQGLTQYGALFSWDQESGSDDLEIIVPGSYGGGYKSSAGSEVYITLERQKLMKPTTESPASIKCGDAIISSTEACDPPGSACSDKFYKRSGVCGSDCKTCALKDAQTCGNKLLEGAEQCESNADCSAGTCKNCACVSAVCGNNLLEKGEMCEKNVDCPAGNTCSACGCVSVNHGKAPSMETPAPSQNIFARFFAWLARLFGG